MRHDEISRLCSEIAEETDLKRFRELATKLHELLNEEPPRGNQPSPLPEAAE